MTNRYSFDMNGRPITLISLTPNQIIRGAIEIEKEEVTENECLYIRETFFANKVLLVLMMMLFFNLILIF